MLPNKDYSIEAIVDGVATRTLLKMFLNGNIKFLLPKPKMIRFNRAEWLVEARETVAQYKMDKLKEKIFWQWFEKRFPGGKLNEN